MTPAEKNAIVKQILLALAEAEEDVHRTFPNSMEGTVAAIKMDGLRESASKL